MFEGYLSWKSTRVFICKTGGLALWMGLGNAALVPEQRRMTRAEEIKQLRAFPYKPDASCRCKDCRYLRIYR